MIEVDHSLLGDVALFDTDRSLSGQEGETFSDPESAKQSGTFPGKVAASLLAGISAIESIYVFSNTISVKRSGGWTVDRLEEAAGIVRNSLIHYENNRSWS